MAEGFAGGLLKEDIVFIVENLISGFKISDSFLWGRKSRSHHNTHLHFVTERLIHQMHLEMLTVLCMRASPGTQVTILPLVSR